MERPPARTLTLAAAAAACLLAAAAHAAPAPSASPDPRTAEIKRRLERFGLRVTDVSHAPAKGTAPAVWVAGTIAQYDQPSWDRITDQALTVWNVMFGVLKSEQAQTLLSSSQDWRTSRLFVTTSWGRIAAFDQGIRSAQTDADRQKVFDALYGGIAFRVFDLQQQKYLDSTEFINQWFKK